VFVLVGSALELHHFKRYPTVNFTTEIESENFFLCFLANKTFLLSRKVEGKWKIPFSFVTAKLLLYCFLGTFVCCTKKSKFIGTLTLGTLDLNHIYS